jgi:hypothetical protein
MKNLSILGILVDERKSTAPKVQEVLTKHGEIITARFGIHDPGEVQNGLITLNVLSTDEELEKLSDELSLLDGVQVKSVTMK